MEDKFTDDDKQKFIDYLNMVAEHAEFKVKTDPVPSVKEENSVR